MSTPSADRIREEYETRVRQTKEKHAEELARIKSQFDFYLEPRMSSVHVIVTPDVIYALLPRTLEGRMFQTLYFKDFADVCRHHGLPVPERDDPDV